MQAVILAAGYGSRLERVSGGAPKCLLPIGGRPLVEHQLEALHDAGVGKILVVVGHKADDVRKTLGNRVEYIENTKYAETNSLYSLWMARDWVKGPFVLLNCDLLFHPDILDRLLSKGGNGLAFDSTSSKGKEQTKVAVSEGKVIDLGKDLAPELSRGESLGLLCFDAKGAKALFSRANALIESGAVNSWVIEGVRSACTEVEIKALNVAGMPWTEIDFPNDYERAQKVVYPAIAKGHWKRSIHWKTTKYVLIAIVAAIILGAGLFLGRYSAIEVEKITWAKEPPIGVEKAILQLPAGQQKWWVAEKGEPLRVSIDGPTTVRIDVRLLMDTGTVEPGRYVIEVGIDDVPVTWKSFKSTPVPEAIFPGAVVGDRDRIKIEVPEGSHMVTVGLLAGTAERILGRISYPETVAADEAAGGDGED
jgi:choline kinase